MSDEMSCTQSRQAMLDSGEAPGPALKVHLDACDACSRRWHRVRSAEASLDALKAPLAPARLQHRVLADLHTQQVFRPQPSRPLVDFLLWLTRGAAATAALSYGVLGIWLAWSVVTQTSSGGNVLPLPVAHAWARLPDARSRAWLVRELGPQEIRPTPTSWRRDSRLLVRTPLNLRRGEEE